MPDNQENTATLILAAGASTRLGSPKQLVDFQEKKLLEKMVETALATPFRPVVVVLGAYAQKIAPSIQHLLIEILENENWESGMGSTIACGMEFLEREFPNLESVMLMLCDQPFVTSEILAKLKKQAKESGLPIAASAYEGTLGPPAFFDKKMFAELKKLEGKAGAKKLFRKYSEQVSKVDFPKGAIDVDMPEDLGNLNSVKNDHRIC